MIHFLYQIEASAPFQTITIKEMCSDVNLACCAQVDEINGRLLKCLLSDWGLISELAKLRNFYFMASPTMQVQQKPLE
jgi:hypothetical protein